MVMKLITDELHNTAVDIYKMFIKLTGFTCKEEHRESPEEINRGYPAGSS
jgi:hypothetical protein